MMTAWWNALPRKIYSELQRVESEQKWFEVYLIKPNIYAFYEPGQFEEVISYLVLGQRRAALIDTGMGIGNMKTLVTGFTHLPVLVVNTHCHYDHVGQNYLFDSVAIFDASNSRQTSKNGYSREEMLPLLDQRLLWKDLPTDFDSGNYHIPPFTVTRWLLDGDIIELGSRRLEVIHTPGHSPDSICLLDRAARLLWTGDTYYPGPIYLHLPGANLDAFIDSYRKLISLSTHYDILVPSHNEPCVSRNALLEVLEATQDIRNGGGKYVEATEHGARIRKYSYTRFGVITKAPT